MAAGDKLCCMAREGVLCGKSWGEIRIFGRSRSGGTGPRWPCGSGTKVELTVKDVCNWLLHSYVWSLAWDSDKKSYAGFFVASDFDREKYVHAIHFTDWQTVLKLCIDESAF